MMHNGNWFVPTFNGELRTDKPPLHYFFMMMAYKIFGENAFAARFFSAIMGLLTVLVSFVYTRRLMDEFTAFCSFLVLGCSTHFLFESRLAVPDPYLIFFITLGLFSAYEWLEKNKPVQLYISAAALALAVLSKGPVALALPGLCLLLWIAMARKWRVAFSLHLLPAFLLFAAIATPWYFMTHKATNGAWTKGFFIDNNLNRFSDTMEGHGGFFLLPLVFVLMGLLPFMIFIGEVFRYRQKIFKYPLVLFAGIVVAVFIIFFSLSKTKLPNYPMPCYAFVSIILGTCLSGIFNRVFTVKKYAYYILLAVMLAIPVAGYFATQQEEALKPFSWYCLLLLPAVLIILYSLVRRKNTKGIWAIAASYTLFNIAGLHIIYPVLYQQNPVSNTLSLVQNAKAVFSYKTFNPAYRFYLQNNIQRTDDVQLLQQWIKANPASVIITRAEFVDSLKNIPLQIVASQKDIFELPTTVILGNK